LRAAGRQHSKEIASKHRLPASTPVNTQADRSNLGRRNTRAQRD